MATSSKVVKPIVIDVDGVYGMMPHGAIIPVGGTTSSTFLVGGVPVLLADGSNGGGGGGTSVSSFQALYDKTIATEDASIVLSTGSAFSILGTDGLNGLVVTPDGNVSVAGNFSVTGTINGISIQTLQTKVNSQEAQINQLLQDIAALQQNVQALVANDTAQAQQLANAQNAINATQDALSALIPRVTAAEANITNVAADLAKHLAGDTTMRHLAADVDLTAISGLSSSTVQGALTELLTKINNIGSGGSNGNPNIIGYEHVQADPSTTWEITHARGTLRVNISVWDQTLKSVVPDSIEVVDDNRVIVRFLTPQIGTAELLLFV